jgi:hypothetical protein
MPQCLTPAEVLAINHHIANVYGLMPLPPRDALLLEMVCARPCMPECGDMCARIGLLVEGLLNSRPLGNCHHATALAALIAALELHKHRLTCSPATLAREVETWGHPVVADDIARWLRLVVEAV